MTDQISVSATCGKCGGSLQTERSDPADEDIVRCDACDIDICTYGEFKQRAMDAAKSEVTSMFKDAFKGSRGVKLKF